MDKSNQQKLVVLIDADNASPSIISDLTAEIVKYGVINVFRIYGDWTKPNLKGWKEVLLDYAIKPIQQFSNTSGKNSTDNALIIDAMDLLYTGKFDGFCIVSSDSDFTRLASRIREEGLKVYGFGENKTPKAFISACDKFIFTEILKADKAELNRVKKPDKKALIDNKKLITLLKIAVEASADDTGWAYLADVGQYITNREKEFDPRNYGYHKLTELIRNVDVFDIDERRDDKVKHIKLIFVKDKERENG